LTPTDDSKVSVRDVLARDICVKREAGMANGSALAHNPTKDKREDGIYNINQNRSRETPTTVPLLTKKDDECYNNDEYYDPETGYYVDSHYSNDPYQQVGTEDNGAFAAETVLDAMDVKAAVEVDANANQYSKNRFMRRGLVCVALLICLIIPVTATAGVLWWGKDEKVMIAAPPTGVPSSAPTSSRAALLMEYLTTVSEKKSLQDRNSPQNEALMWLSDEDGMKLSHDDPNFHQRFILAVFYFATNGDNWSKCFRGDVHCTDSPNKVAFLSPEHECNWNGIFCDENKKISVISLGTSQGFNLDGTLPSELSEFTTLTRLMLPSNKLRGEIPTWLGRLTNLKNLRLYSNEFEGTLPDSLFNLVDLQTLSIRNNNITGTISPKIGRLTSLKHLFLSTNNFNGNLPDDIYNMVNLEEVYLAENKFSGSLSSRIVNFLKLEELVLSQNYFSGPIPEELGYLTGLEKLALHNNDFSGTMPSLICLLRSEDEFRLDYLTSDCGGIPPRVQCTLTCCTECGE